MRLRHARRKQVNLSVWRHPNEIREKLKGSLERWKNWTNCWSIDFL